MMQAVPLLRVDGISKRFSGLQALKDVRFDVDRGSIAGVMGANGAGKTTLFSIIAGNELPDNGNVVLNGSRLIGRRPDQMCRSGIARTFQVVRPFGGLSLLENVTAAALFGSHRRVTQKDAVETARKVLHELDLYDHRDVRAADLTLSRQKRLEVARAVATGPEVLLLDEVMAGLTAAEVDRMMEIVEGLRSKQGITILVIEHVMQALMRLSDKVVVLHLGEVVTEGTPEQIRTDARVHEIYFGKAT